MTEGSSPSSPLPDRYQTGATITTSSRTITMTDIEEFATLTGDQNPLHLDEEFARGQLFGGRIAHGLLSLSITLGLWYRAGLFDGWVVIFSGIDELRFRRPVRPGETLTARLTVLSRESSPRGEKVELENTTCNEKDEPVLSFSARLLLARPRPTENSKKP